MALNLPNRKRAAIAFVLVATTLIAGCSSWRVDKAARVATGYASHLLCDDVFITGANADTAFAERIKPLPGMGLVNWGLKRELDSSQGTVSVSVVGLFKSHARYSEGIGCIALPANESLPQVADTPDAFNASRFDINAVMTISPALNTDAQLNEVLTRHLKDAAHRTKAIVVVRDNQLIAEQYAAGYNAETPVLGFSMTKTVTNALIGILVKQGRLSLEQAAPIAAWNTEGDPRQAITIEQLLRQVSGLALPQNNSGFDITSQIMYSERNKIDAITSASLNAPPGTRWNYTDTNYLLLSRIVRDAVGGTAKDVREFVYNELFAPLGMRHARFDFDDSGTPIGSSHMLASARDWARFGGLYLNDGLAGSQRILPNDWVQRSTSPTLDTGYGAGIWTNREGLVPGWGVPWGLSNAPRDTFFARGFMGNFVVVIPSQRLVIVRLSVSHFRGDDIEGTNAIVGDVLHALRLAQ